MSRLLALLSRMDWFLFLAALLLSLVGLAAIGSVALAHDPPDFSLLAKQATILAAGIALAVALAVGNYRALDHYARLLYVVAAGLLILVLVTGATIRGTRSWFGVAGFGIQPVEFAKIASVVILARFMATRAHMKDLRSFLSSGTLAGLLAGLVLLQPDFGGATLLVAVWAALVLLAGANRRHLFLFALAAGVVAALAWFVFFQDYQRDRIRTFFDPSRDAYGRGYNVTQATIAIGAGGLFGRGLGSGSQSQLRFLPEAQTDFVFAVIAEELGFVAVASLLGLFALFFVRTLRLARRAPDNFTLFLVFGLLAHLFFSFLVNVGMNLGVSPVAGVALPFLSAGGSSLLATWIAVGLLESVAIRSRSPRGSLTAPPEGLIVEG